MTMDKLMYFRCSDCGEHYDEWHLGASEWIGDGPVYWCRMCADERQERREREMNEIAANMFRDHA